VDVDAGGRHRPAAGAGQVEVEAKLSIEDREQINQACSVLRKARQQVSLGTPTVPAPSVDIRAVGRT